MSSQEDAPTPEWNQDVVYQVYPRSFNEVREGQHVGEGTIKGITEKIDYLQELGVTALWISPFYPSPMRDGGYDISDHQDVDPRFGNLEHFKELVGEAHAHGLKIIVDLVLNHTSIDHPWFQDSKEKSSDKSNWYIWKDAKYDENGHRTPPNNWASVFSMHQHTRRLEGDITVGPEELTPPVSAWSWDEDRKQYYLHSFANHQPDLNWDNSEVREAAKDIMRFWLELGVDGFRADAIPYIGKNQNFVDEKPNPDYHENDRQETIDSPSRQMDYPNPYDQLMRNNSSEYMPVLMPLIKDINDVLDEYPDRSLWIMHEAYMNPGKLEKITGLSVHNSSAFNFTSLDVKWNAKDYKQYLETYHENLPVGATPNQVRGNHDKPRIASPHDLGTWPARALAVLNLTLPGHIYIYNGEEGGFTDVNIADEDLQDKLGYRDYSRTPMLWRLAKNAGFSKADKTWLPIDPLYQFKVLSLQKQTPRSTYRLYRDALKLREEHKALNTDSSFRTLPSSNSDVLAFVRGEELGKEAIVTLVNFSDSYARTSIQFEGHKIGWQVISSGIKFHPRRLSLEDLRLSPNEAIVIEFTDYTNSRVKVRRIAGKVKDKLIRN